MILAGVRFKLYLLSSSLNITSWERGTRWSRAQLEPRCFFSGKCVWNTFDGLLSESTKHECCVHLLTCQFFTICTGNRNKSVNIYNLCQCIPNNDHVKLHALSMKNYWNWDMKNGKDYVSQTSKISSKIIVDNNVIKFKLCCKTNF